MRKAIQGDRTATFGVLLGLLAVMAVAVALILFVLDTRSTARDSQRVARAAVQSEQELRATIIKRCTDRLAYDQRFVNSTKGDLDFYKTLDEIAKANPIPPGTDPKVIDLYKRQVAAIAKQRAAKELILKEGVIGNCEVYRATPKPSPGI